MSLPDATFAVYFATDDDIIECTACDPDAGDAADWPAWTDADRWELGRGFDPASLVPPELEPDEDLVEPSESDLAWYLAELAELGELPPLAGGAPEPLEPYAGEDWLEYDAWARRVAELHQGDDQAVGYLSDRDIITATGGCG